MNANTPSLFFVTGGTLRPDAPSYIERPTDDELLKSILDGNYCYVLTARQMGKSSLMVRTTRRLSHQGFKTAVIDLTNIGTQEASADQWYFSFLDALSWQLKLSADLDSWWENRQNLSLVRRFSDFITDVVLAEIAEPVVIFVDEIDVTLGLDFSDDFFAAIRVLYNSRAINDKYDRLIFVLLGVATPSELISDPEKTPFNIGGKLLELTDFTYEDVLPYANWLHLPVDESREALAWIYQQTNGHPYLTQHLCEAFISKNKELEGDKEAILEQTYLGTEAQPNPNLRFVADMLLRRKPVDQNQLAVFQIYKQVQRGKIVPDRAQSVAKSHLKLSGLLKAEQGNLVVRNPIYARTFDKAWLKANWPVAWWVSYWRTYKYYISLMILGIFLALGLFWGSSRLYAVRISEPQQLANEHIQTLQQDPPVSRTQAKAAAKGLVQLAREANKPKPFTDFIVECIWANEFEEIKGHYEQSGTLLMDYYRRAFLNSSPQLRLELLEDMITLGGQENLDLRDSVLASIEALTPEARREIWLVNNLPAQKDRIRDIGTALHPIAEQASAQRTLAFLAEGAIRVGEDTLAERTLRSLRLLAVATENEQMILIPAGEFIMGTNAENGFEECLKLDPHPEESCPHLRWVFADEEPEHLVTLDAFFMDEFETTIAQYDRCVASGVCMLPSDFRIPNNRYYFDKSFANYPMDRLNWYDATIYCAWRGVRLPTEAEWEKAARGETGLIYPWGNEFDGSSTNFCDNNCDQKWFYADFDDGYKLSAPVGTYPKGASPYGVQDMAGNIWEWVADWYDESYYAHSSVEDPPGPSSGTLRGLRGGSFIHTGYFLRTTDRHGFDPDNLNANFGVRCARFAE